MALGAAAMVWVAIESGEAFYRRLGMPALARGHTELGDSMHLFVLGLTVAVLVLACWPDASGRPGRGRPHRHARDRHRAGHLAGRACRAQWLGRRVGRHRGETPRLLPAELVQAVDGRSQRLTRVVVSSIIISQHGAADSGGLGQVLGVRVVWAEYPAAALQGVLAQGAGRLRLTQMDQGEGKGGRRPQGDQMIRAEHPAAALQGVLAQGAGRLRLRRFSLLTAAPSPGRPVSR